MKRDNSDAEELAENGVTLDAESDQLNVLRELPLIDDALGSA